MNQDSAGQQDQIELEAEAFEASFRHKPDGDEDPAGEAGWFLQREREKRGESLEVAGEATGIHPYHIEAIEFGDMTRMPQRIEALEMIGIYAQYLGFDPDPLVRHYARILPRPAVTLSAHPANPAPLSSAKILRFARLPKLPQFKFNIGAIPGGTGGLVASVAGAVFLFAGATWIMMPPSEPAAPIDQMANSSDPMPTASTGGDAATVTVADEPMPDDQAQAAQPEQQSAEAPAATDPAGADTTGTGLNGLTELIQQEVDPSQAQPLPVPAKTETVAAATSDDVQMTSEGREFGAKTGGTRLILKAKAPVWVRVEDSQGNVVMTQMLMKGDTYRVPDRDGLVVIARDGGLLSYLIDGKEKGVLGTPGEILVGRSLDLKTLEGNG